MASADIDRTLYYREGPGLPAIATRVETAGPLKSEEPPMSFGNFDHAPPPVLTAVPVPARIYDSGRLRAALEDRQTALAVACEVVERAALALRRAQDRVAEVEAQVADHVTQRAAVEAGEVERLHAAALSDDPLILPAFHAVDYTLSDHLERSLPTLRALVARLDGELASVVTARNLAEVEVARAVSDLMEAEAEGLAHQLWEAKERVESIRLRLGGLYGQIQPHRADPADPNAIRTAGVKRDLGGGAFIVDPDLMKMAKPYFQPSPRVARALADLPGHHALPSQDPQAEKFIVGPTPGADEATAWTRWAADLRVNPFARLCPLPEIKDAL